MHLAYQILMVALMVFGFGFVVFFHELGHFLAAKWVGIKVEQFAVGFGQALFAWRKGIGWRVGSTQTDYRERAIEWLSKNEKGSAPNEYADEQIAKAADELGLGETEYRLNWVPLGGYVKMLGQDDLKPNATASDPRAYNRKSVGKRMIVVSAGVIMNIILAAIGFMVLFLIGFNAPGPVVGKVLTGSPADLAGIRVGDRIVSIDGTKQYDFNRIVLSTALLKANHDVPVEVERRLPDGSTKVLTLALRPAQMSEDPKSFLAIGVAPGFELRGPDATEETDEAETKLLNNPERFLPDLSLLKPGDTITAIGDHAVTADDVRHGQAILDEAVRQADGKPVAMTVRGKDGSTRTVEVHPRIEQAFGTSKVNVAGMEPRPRIEDIPENTSVAGKLKSGDEVEWVSLGGDTFEYPSNGRFRKLALESGAKGEKMTVAVLRDGKVVKVPDLEATTKVENQKGRFLGIGIGYDESPVVSEVMENSPAKRAGVAPGTKLTEVDGKPVSNWFEVRNLLATEGKHSVTGLEPGEDAKPKTFALEMAAADVDALHHSLHATTYLPLHEMKEVRKTSNPIEAMSWGLAETRDFVLQFYVTLARMFQGSVSYTNMMGPLGIVTSGARFAFRGADWLIWFLAMISANLAVVNFLPIPIVDGGLFSFLILEKIQGKPLSPRAQTIAQVVGFAVIISVFLLVTFQDIKRTMGM